MQESPHCRPGPGFSWTIIRENGDVIRYLAVKPVAIGALHHYVIRIFDILGIPDQRLILIADVTGKIRFSSKYHSL